MNPVAAVSGPIAPVPKDPQPSVDRIEELARRILTGDILLPKFQRMLSSVSNKRITNRAPSDYLREVVNAAGANLDKWLASNLVPRDAFDLAIVDNFEGFIARRAAHLEKTVLELC